LKLVIVNKTFKLQLTQVQYYMPEGVMYTQGIFLAKFHIVHLQMLSNLECLL